MRIIFIRHGDPDYSIDSLTKKGRREAELLAQRVSRWKIDSIYCSPLGRAQATAAYSLEKLGRTAVTKEFLREFKGHVYNPYNGLDHICWDLMPDYWTQSETMYDKDNWTSDPIIKGSRDDIAAEWKMVQDGIDEIIELFKSMLCSNAAFFIKPILGFLQSHLIFNSGISPSKPLSG